MVPADGAEVKLEARGRVRVAIVGAGVGGLVAALALHARGTRPLLLERAATLGEVGAGVQLGPNAVRVLDRLGLAAEVRRVAHRPEAIAVRRAADGRRLLTLPLGEAAERRWGAPYLQLHRADLQALLLAAVRARDAADLRLGAGVDAAFEDGELRLGDGSRLDADAVLVADGVRSRLRARVAAGEPPPRPSGHLAWRALVPAAALPHPVEAGVWTAPRAHFVHYPVRGGALVNLVGVSEGQAAGGEDWSGRGDPAEFAALFGGWPAPVAALVRAATEVGRWALHDRPPATVLARGRLALVGDAGHPVLPYLAQGAAMAVEDGWAAAEALAGAAPAEAADALAAYAAARLPRVRRVQRASARNGRLFHLPDPVAGGAFAVARALELGRRDGALARLDWLYGGGPVS